VVRVDPVDHLLPPKVEVGPVEARLSLVPVVVPIIEFEVEVKTEVEAELVGLTVVLGSSEVVSALV